LFRIWCLGFSALSLPIVVNAAIRQPLPTVSPIKRHLVKRKISPIRKKIIFFLQVATCQLPTPVLLPLFRLVLRLQSSLHQSPIRIKAFEKRCVFSVDPFRLKRRTRKSSVPCPVQMFFQVSWLLTSISWLRAWTVKILITLWFRLERFTNQVLWFYQTPCGFPVPTS